MVLAVVGALTAAHLLLGMGSAAARAVHVTLGALYLVPVLLAAWWFGWRGGVGVAVLASAIYAWHVAASYPTGALVGASQAALVAMLLATGTLTGVLAERGREERARRLEAERRARKSLAVSGMLALLNSLTRGEDRGHGERVARVASAVGLKMGLEPDRLDLLRIAARVHDVAGDGTGADPLGEREGLGEEERSRVERHPVAAAAMLRNLGGMEEVAEIVLAHHECPDGSGYPGRLRSPEEVPVEARVLRVADVFATLTHELAGEDRISETVARMRRMAGTRVDAEAVEALAAVVGRWSGDRDIGGRDGASPGENGRSS